jgi:hypothetical protein
MSARYREGLSLIAGFSWMSAPWPATISAAAGRSCLNVVAVGTSPIYAQIMPDTTIAAASSAAGPNADIRPGHRLAGTFITAGR